MPCYEVNLITMEFKAAKEGLLKAAAESLGYTFEKYGNLIRVENRTGSYSVSIRDGLATSSNQENINALKRAYSVETIKQAAKAKGWSGNWSDLKTKNTVTVRKF